MSCITNDCFEIEEPKCGKGCDPVVNTDCIFHNVASTDQSAKLFNIGVTTGSSLKHILKQIDKKLEYLLSTDFNSFNVDSLGVIENIKQFAEAVNSKIKELEEINTLNNSTFEIITTNLETLSSTLGEVINIDVSNSTVNVNSTDTLRAVLIKILSFLEDINNPLSLEFEDTASINFTANSNIVSADLNISAVQGNTIRILDDGLFSVNPSITSILTAIKDNPELKALFKELVTSSLPASEFNIMSESNAIIKWRDINGIDLTSTAKANTLLKLENVRQIISAPTTGLTITYKGIKNE